MNHSIGLAVWEKDDAERIQYMRGVGRRGQTNTTRKQRAIGKVGMKPTRFSMKYVI